MSLHITEHAMHSGDTIHAAARIVDAATPFVDSDHWRVTWLPGRVLTRNQAITALILAETITAMQDQGATSKHPMWPHVDNWARELGLTGPHAMTLVTEGATAVHDRYVAELGEAGATLRRIHAGAVSS